MRRLESSLRHDITYRFDIVEEEPFYDVRFTILKGSRKTLECHRTYDASDIGAIIDEFWSDRPKLNGQEVYLEPRSSLVLEEAVTS